MSIRLPKLLVAFHTTQFPLAQYMAALNLVVWFLRKYGFITQAYASTNKRPLNRQSPNSSYSDPSGQIDKFIVWPLIPIDLSRKLPCANMCIQDQRHSNEHRQAQRKKEGKLNLSKSAHSQVIV